MPTHTTTFTYCGYRILVTYNNIHMNCSFQVFNFENKILISSKRYYDSIEDAYVRACTRINDEL